jgi:prevent-host-death family protein
MGIFMPLTTIHVPISEARSDLCALVKKVESGNVRVCLISHGRPKALIVPCAPQLPLWRTDEPDDPARYGDLQAPVLEEWP